MRKIYQDQIGNIATNPDNLTGNIWVIEETNGIFSEKNKKPYHGHFSDGYYKESVKVTKESFYYNILGVIDPEFNRFISPANLKNYFIVMEISHGREKTIEWYNKLKLIVI